MTKRGRVKSGRDEKSRRARCNKNVWGFGDLPLEFP
jgi:hypothetical protein